MADNPPAPRLCSWTTALLIIDVQRALFSKSTPIFMADQLIHNINTLADRCHAADATVIYIQHSNKTLLIKGSNDWQLHPGLKPRETDLIIHKNHGNAFEDTSLKDELVTRDIKNLMITGLVTHGCVRATCLGGLDLGYRVILIEDGHSNYNRDASKVIEEWNKKLSEVNVELIPAAQIGFE